MIYWLSCVEIGTHHDRDRWNSFLFVSLFIFLLSFLYERAQTVKHQIVENSTQYLICSACFINIPSEIKLNKIIIKNLIYFIKN